MTYILVLGAFIFFAARVFGGRRTITPRIVQEAQQERRVMTSVRREPPVPPRTADRDSAQIEPEAPVAPSGYLLGGRRARSGDRMAAMMDMMSGPGVCTPRDP